MGPATVTLIKAIADASDAQIGMWPREHIIREVAGSIAIAVQRGNAMTFLEGYDRAQAAALAQTAVSAKRKAREAEGGEVEIIGSAETTDEEESGEEE